MTDDQLLTDDALAAIAARAEALSTLNGTLSRVKQLRDPDWRLGVISGHVAYPLDDDQAEIAWRFVEHAQDDVPRLLAHIRAQDAEIARLRDALAALVDAEAHGTPGGYIGVDPSGETHDRHCTYCYTSWQLGEPERHAPDCPIAAGRRAEETVPGAHRCRS